MRKFLFINAIDTTREVETRYPGLGLAYLASSLRENFGHGFFDFKIIEGGNEQAVRNLMDQFRPDVVAVSSVTQNFGMAKRIITFLKSRQVPVIVGGVHVTTLPQSLPKDADVACLGEGELTIVELMRVFEKNSGFPKKEIVSIRGIAFWDDDGKLVVSEPRPLIQNLDDIPLPARDLLEIEKHSYIFSSRGCPYRCAFCASSRFWDKVRLFSAQYVVDEIKELYYKYGVGVISFFDDLFIISPSRLDEITELLRKEGLLGKIKFTCSCRSNLVNGKIAESLEKMGVVSVGLGLESGNDRILKYLKGGTASVSHNRNAVNHLKNRGISVNASFVVGSPDETEREMMDTYNFIRESRLDLVDVYVLMPFPGTPVWEYAKQKNLVSEDMDWSILSANFDEDHGRAVIVSEIYNRQQMYDFYKRFQKLRFYKNMKNIWRSPFLTDLPKYVFKIIKQKSVGFFRC